MRPAPVSTFGAFLSLLLGAACTAASAAAQELPQVPYLTTPTGTVQRMLELVEVTAADTVYDLGSGDGRIPIIAAGRYGARAVGVELRRDLVEEARKNARSAGVQDRVRFVHDDLFDVDLAPATVVTIYLLPSVNLRLRPKLLRELRPGARVVSNGFRMGAWTPDLNVRDLEDHMVLYGWIVPARVQGRWRLRPPEGEPLLLEVDQRFQELRVRVAKEEATDDTAQGASGLRVVGASLRGPRIELTLRRPGEDDPVRFRGTVSGDAIRGTTPDGAAWWAERLSTGGALERWEGEP